jgi:hypothetical protein
MATGRPEVDVAATPKLEPYAASDGAAVVTLMVWSCGQLYKSVTVTLAPLEFGIVPVTGSDPEYVHPFTVV